MNLSSDPGNESLAGSLLLAYPGMGDPNFQRTVILLSAHSPGEGSMGVVINRPLNKTLADIDPDMQSDPLAEIPIYQGGPVQPDQLILSAWEWSPLESVFRLFLGIDPDKARYLQQNHNMHLRAFLGYAGWGQGQLEEELAENTWIACRINEKTIPHEDGLRLWKNLLESISPTLRLLADRPDDPGKN